MVGSQGLLLDSLVYIYIIIICSLGILEQIIDLTSYYTLCFVPSTPGVLPDVVSVSPGHRFTTFVLRNMHDTRFIF